MGNAWQALEQQVTALHVGAVVVGGAAALKAADAGMTAIGNLVRSNQGQQGTPPPQAPTVPQAPKAPSVPK